MRKDRLLWLFFLLVLIFLSPKTLDAQVKERLPGYLGSAKCESCHKKEYDQWEKSSHAKTEEAAIYPNLRGCEGCHGPGASHVAAPSKANIVTGGVLEGGGTFSCLKCHGTLQAKGVPNDWKRVNSSYWKRSGHYESVSCFKCHAAHSPQKNYLKGEANGSCQSCHQKFKAASHSSKDWQNCLTCHNPHGTGLAYLVRTTVSQSCLGCHPAKGTNPAHRGYDVSRSSCLPCHAAHEKNGMKPYAHDPYLKRNCTACHKPPNQPGATKPKADIKALCAGCHDPKFASTDRGKNHKLVTMGMCTGCHEPHATMSPKKTLKDVAQVACTSCHGRVDEMMHEKFRHKVMEEKESCLKCHKAHLATFPSLLTANKIKGCTDCHQRQLKFTHPLEDAEDKRTGKPMHCSSCHDPHGSPFKDIMSFEETALCMQCHKVGEPGRTR